MRIEDITSGIAGKLGLAPDVTEKAVGTIFSVIEHEAAPGASQAIFEHIPGAADLAHRFDVAAADPSLGIFGQLSATLGGVFGSKAVAMLTGLSQLESIGLDGSQLQQAARTLFGYVEQAAGPEVVTRLVSSAPGLMGQLGL